MSALAVDVPPNLHTMMPIVDKPPIA